MTNAKHSSFGLVVLIQVSMDRENKAANSVFHSEK